MKQNSELTFHGLVVRREVSERGGSSIYTCNGYTKVARGAIAVKQLEKWALDIKEGRV